ncbi:MAG: signal peptidase II [Oscillospiraceae bacterium]
MVYIALLMAAVLVGIDQIIKIWAYSNLRLTDTLAVIPNVLHLTYHENTGAAFSMLSERTTFLAVATGLLLLAIVVLMLYKKPASKFLNITLGLIIAGGVGNLIDRVWRGFVVDYVDFRLINFAVFNFADICVVIGTGMLMIYLLFIDGRNKENNNAR